MTGHPDAGALRAVPFLAELSPDDAEGLAARLASRRLSPGEVLFRQGDPGESVYVLASGEVDVRLAGAEHDHDLLTLGPGTLIGEFALLAEARRTRSVVARGEVDLWELTRTAFDAGLHAGEGWAVHFLLCVARELARQMRAVDELLVGLMDECRLANPPAARVRELEKLRRQLSGEWTF